MLNCSYILSPYLSRELFIFLTLIITVSVVIIYAKKKSKHWYDYIGIFLLLVGGFPNLVSRLKDGCVVDNISIFSSLYINIWDIIVVAGIIILFGGLIHESKGSDN